MQFTQDSNENVFIDTRMSACKQNIVMSGVQGGNVFLHFKSTQSQTNTGGFTIDLGGSGHNTFISFDFDESFGSPQTRITSDHNQFIHGSFSDQTTLTVSGKHNIFDKAWILGTVKDTGTGNAYRKPRILQGILDLSGAVNAEISGELVEGAGSSVIYGSASRPAAIPATQKALQGRGFPVTFESTDLTAFQPIVAANYVHLLRVKGSGTISKIGLQVGTSSGNISVGVFTGPKGRAQATTRIATSGAVACPAAGYAEISLGGSVVVNDGDWFGISADNVTATFFALLGGAVTVSDLGFGLAAFAAASHPVPATLVAPASCRNSTIQLIGVA